MLSLSDQLKNLGLMTCVLSRMTDRTPYVPVLPSSKAGSRDTPIHPTLHLQPSFRWQPTRCFIIHAIAERAGREMTVSVR